jgi:hypothetical protein
MDIQTLRFNAQSLKKVCDCEKNPILKKYWVRKFNAAKSLLDQATRFDSALKPMRTPWKRLQGPSRHFEQL